MTATATATASEAARFHRIFADPTRVAIVRALAEKGETRVGDLCSSLGTEQTATSHALALLRTSGVVRDRREGRRVFYSVADGTAERLAPLLLYPLKPAE